MNTINDFFWPVRVYYEDTDAGGVVYHTGYLRFMERARTEWLRSLGWEQTELMREFGVLFAVHSMQIDFLRPAHFDDALTVVTRTQEVGKASLLFEQVINRGEFDGVELCRASVRIACLDVHGFRPRAMPEDLLASFKPYEDGLE